MASGDDGGVATQIWTASGDGGGFRCVQHQKSLPRASSV